MTNVRLDIPVTNVLEWKQFPMVVMEVSFQPSPQPSEIGVPGTSPLVTVRRIDDPDCLATVLRDPEETVDAHKAVKFFYFSAL